MPTKDRVGDLRACLTAIRAQTRAPELVVVVDNGSSDGTREYLAGAEGVTALPLDRNTGAPGGFSAGVGKAFALGASWVWLLDDDALPDRDALQLMLERAAAESPDAGPVAAVVPTVEFGDGRRETGWLWGARAAAGHGQSPNVADAAGKVPSGDVDWAPFAGLLVAREPCETVGEIRADFVLWHADVEYCLRLRAAGFRLLAAPRATVRHPEMPLISRRILGRTVSVGDYPAWREYYDTRNRVILDRGLRGTPLASRTSLLRRLRDELLRDAAVVIADPRGARRLWMRALGASDGMRAEMGRRPELEHS